MVGRPAVTGSQVSSESPMFPGLLELGMQSSRDWGKGSPVPPSQHLCLCSPERPTSLSSLADEETKLRQVRKPASPLAMEGSGSGLPDSRIWALCTSPGCLSPCPVISAKSRVFLELHQEGGLFGRGAVLGLSRPDRVNAASRGAGRASSCSSQRKQSSMQVGLASMAAGDSGTARIERGGGQEARGRRIQAAARPARTWRRRFLAAETTERESCERDHQGRERDRDLKEQAEAVQHGCHLPSVRLRLVQGKCCIL